ncbi:MAG: DnaJ domain-containing protein [Anaerolineae bacterium]|nr:DnaJ domain-containing protein [Anaerolineae bacterium]
MTAKEAYQILELPENASPRRIREQYRALAKCYHPDRFVDPAERAKAAETFKKISQAYKDLLPVARQTRLSPQERRLNALYEQGRQLYDQKKWAQALALFTEILTIDPTYQDTLTLLREARRKQKALLALYTEAEQYLQQRKWSEAKTRFEQVAQHDPHYRDTSQKLKRARRELLKQGFLEQ